MATQWAQAGRDRDYKAETDLVMDAGAAGGGREAPSVPVPITPKISPELWCSFGGCIWIQMLTLLSSGRTVLNRQFEV